MIIARLFVFLSSGLRYFRNEIDEELVSSCRK